MRERPIHDGLLLATSPGVVIHEIAHLWFCQRYKIPIKDVCFFQMGQPAGYVVHARPRKYFHTFMISVAPFILNNFIGLLFGVLTVATFRNPDIVSVFGIKWTNLLFVLFFAWVGVSACVHSLPSNQDARLIWEQTKRRWINPFVWLGIPFVVIIFALNRVHNLYIGVVYGVLVVGLGVLIGNNPYLLVEAIPVEWMVETSKGLN